MQCPRRIRRRLAASVRVVKVYRPGRGGDFARSDIGTYNARHDDDMISDAHLTVRAPVTVKPHASPLPRRTDVVCMDIFAGGNNP